VDLVGGEVPARAVLEGAEDRAPLRGHPQPALTKELHELVLDGHSPMFTDPPSGHNVLANTTS